MFFCSVSFGQEEIKIYTTVIKRINTVDKQGIYNKFIGQFANGKFSNINIEFMPAERSFRAFKANKKSCFFPFSLSRDSQRPSGITLSKSLGDVELFAVTTKKNSKFITRKKLLKAPLVVRDIYKFGLGLKLEEAFFVDTERQLYSMLDRGRVDYVLESVPDAYTYFVGGKKEFDKLYHFDKKSPILIIEDFVACHSSYVRGRNLIKRINRRL